MLLDAILACRICTAAVMFIGAAFVVAIWQSAMLDLERKRRGRR